MTRYSEKVTSFLPLQRSISIHGHSKDYIAGRVTFTLPLPGIRTYCLWLVYSDVNCYSSLYVEGDHAFRPYLRMKINHKYLEMKIKNQTTTEVGGPVLYSLTINTYALCFNPTFMKTSKTEVFLYRMHQTHQVFSLTASWFLCKVRLCSFFVLCGSLGL